MLINKRGINNMKYNRKGKTYSSLKRNEPDYLLSFFFGGVAVLVAVALFTLAYHGVL